MWEKGTDFIPHNETMKLLNGESTTSDPRLLTALQSIDRKMSNTGSTNSTSFDHNGYLSRKKIGSSIVTIREKYYN